MTRFVLIILFLPSFAYAQNVIDDYVPPPMFGEAQSEEATFPPVPPKRPAKLNVSQSYIEKLKKREQKKHVRQGLSEDQLVEQTAQDILRQINPQ